MGKLGRRLRNSHGLGVFQNEMIFLFYELKCRPM